MKTGDDYIELGFESSYKVLTKSFSAGHKFDTGLLMSISFKFQ